MRIALFTDTFEPQINGVARTLSRLTKYLENNSIEHKVIMPTFESPAYEISSQHYAIKSFPFFLYPECRLAIPYGNNLKHELKGFQPDLIHIATPFNVGLFGMHFGRKANIPMVASYHTHFDRYLTYYHLDFLSPLLWRYLQWFHRPFQKIFVPSEETKQLLTKHSFTNLSIWSRGVDCSHFSPYKSNNYIRQKYNIKEKYIFLFVGRLAPEKDLDVLYEIIKKAPPPLQENVHWLIVGDGPSQSWVKTWENKFTNLTSVGYLTGDELAHVYSSSDLFVFPSSTETFGNVVLEAHASGLPAIVSNRGGVTEIVKDKITGMICESKNADAFLQSITSLLDEPFDLEQMRINARNHALSKSWSAIFGSLLSHYEEVAYDKEKQKSIIA